MKTKTTIVLLVIAILLGVYIFIIEERLPTTDELEEQKNKILVVKPEDITRIEIGVPNAERMTIGAITPTSPSRIAIVCVKTNDQWEMTEPVKTRADKTVLDGITNQLSDLQKRETVKEVTTLTPYGLDEPPITLTFSTRDKAYSLRFGKQSPLNIGNYLAVEGRKEVYVVPTYFVDSVNKPVSHFRHKKIFDTDTYNINTLKFIRPGETIELQKIDNQWHIREPVSEKAEEQKTREILSQISTLSVTTFIADNETDLARYGLDRPELKIVVPDPQDSTKSETLLLGIESEKHPTQFTAFKEGTQTIFTIERNSYAMLLTPLNDIRRREFFDLTPAEVNKIKINYKEKIIVELNKDAERKWQFIYPSMTATGAAPYDVDGFIEKLNTYHIEQFVADTVTDLAPYGLTEPFKGIEIILGVTNPDNIGAPESHALVGIAEKTDYVYLKKSDSPRVVAMNYSLYEYLKKGSINFRKRGLMDIAPDKVKRITISLPDKGMLVYEQTKPREWKTPDEKPLDKPDNLNNLMNELCYLTAADFVADLNFNPDIVSYELNKPQATVMIEWQEGDMGPNNISPSPPSGKDVLSRTLLVGKKTDDLSAVPTGQAGHYYARFAEDVIIFKITPNILNTIIALY